MEVDFFLSQSKYNEVKNRIIELVKQDKNKFIIYPYGEVGKQVQEIVKEVGGNIEFYIDNFKFNNEDIFNIEQAKKRKTSDSIILICSLNDNSYDVIRSNIKDVFSADDMIDLFQKVYISDKSLKTNLELLLNMEI